MKADVQVVSPVRSAPNAVALRRKPTIRYKILRMNDADLKDLVDYPVENLGVELKEWVDLSDNVVRAKIARHVAALANHGGGYIVIGFCDDGTVAGKRPADLGPYNRDTFAAIVKKYLSPHFHCDVTAVPASSDELYPIVRVPSHRSAPICAKASGPHDKNNKPQGIVQGTYYLRLPGPESAPITTHDQWQGVIRRCVLAERDFIVEALSGLADTSGNKLDDHAEVLSQFHGNCRERFRHLVSRSTKLVWSVPLAENYYQLSYRIISTEDAEISAEKFIPLLNRANVELRDIVWTGWSMFYPFTRPEIRPVVEPETIDGNDTDVYVTSHVNDQTTTTTMPDYWRMTRTGMASLVRGYREDRGREPDDGETRFSPYILVREITELLGHALIVAKDFPHAERIEFIGSWNGLSGRVLVGRDGTTWDYYEQTAKSNSRTIKGAWSNPKLQGAWVEIVTDLANRILILFDRYQVSEQQVNSMAASFKTL